MFAKVCPNISAIDYLGVNHVLSEGELATFRAGHGLVKAKVMLVADQ